MIKMYDFAWIKCYFGSKSLVVGKEMVSGWLAQSLW
jgi:hypothetical protein